MAGSNEPREKAVPKYFIKTPEKPILEDVSRDKRNATIGGVLMLLSLILAAIAVIWPLQQLFWQITRIYLGFGNMLFLASVLLIIGLWRYTSANSSRKRKEKDNAEAMAKYQEAFDKAEPKPSDQQMDAWLNGDVQRVKQDGLQKLDLEHTPLLRDPIVVIGPSQNAAARAGEDGILRFTYYEVVCVYLTEYHLAAYNGRLDMHDGVVTRESTQEYHYSDVISVSTRTESSLTFTLVVNGQHKSIPLFQEFALSVASGEQIRVVTAFPNLDEYIQKGKMPITGADQAITAIRSRLREKKGGVPA